MTQFAVHLYPTVRVKVVGIEAGSIEEAVAKAEASVDLHAALDNLRPAACNGLLQLRPVRVDTAPRFGPRAS